jgi:hypothetical protein
VSRRSRETECCCARKRFNHATSLKVGGRGTVWSACIKVFWMPDQLIFLGFGYLQLNREVLRPSDGLQNLRIYETLFCESGPAQAVADARIRALLRTGHAPLSLSLVNEPGSAFTIFRLSQPDGHVKPMEFRGCTPDRKSQFRAILLFLVSLHSGL